MRPVESVEGRVGVRGGGEVEASKGAEVVETGDEGEFGDELRGPVDEGGDVGSVRWVGRRRKEEGRKVDGVVCRRVEEGREEEGDGCCVAYVAVSEGDLIEVWKREDGRGRKEKVGGIPVDEVER